jgi:type II secretory pathway component PulF
VWSNLAFLAANEVGGVFRRNVTAAAFYAASGITALAGIVFGLVAAHSWLSTHMSEIDASLSIAGALIVLAMLIAGIGYFIKNRRRTRTEITSTALIALPIAARLVSSRVNWGTMTVAGIMAAGVLLGRKLGDKD